jgi:hypothetical protein
LISITRFSKKTFVNLFTILFSLSVFQFSIPVDAVAAPGDASGSIYMNKTSIKHIYDAALDVGAVVGGKTESFTVEMWIKPTNTGTCSYGNVGPNGLCGEGLWAAGFESGDVNIGTDTGGNMCTDTTQILVIRSNQWCSGTSGANSFPAINTWSHIAWTVDATGYFNLYIGGIRKMRDKYDLDMSLRAVNRYLFIGKSDRSSFTGYMSNVRLVKNAAIYSGESFTPPTTQLSTSVVAGTTQLLMQAQDYATLLKDNSGNVTDFLPDGGIEASGVTPANTRSGYISWSSESPFGLSQSITFNSLNSKNATDPNFDVSASASSGLTVSFSSATGTICTVTTSGTVDILKAGICTINANQAGDASYFAASQVSQGFTVNRVAQTITLDSISDKDTGSADFTVSVTPGASTSSVVISSANNSYCTVSGTTVHIVAAGTCTIRANQAQDDIYSAATQVSQSFTISQLYTVTYNSGTLGTGSVPTQSSKLTGGTFTVASGSGLSREGFSFNGWKDASNNSYAYNSTFTVASTNVALTAQWRQNSLFGISDADLSTASTLAFTTGGFTNSTISFDDGIGSATVRVPFNAFTKNVDVKVQALTDTNFAKNKVDASKSFPINLVVSWLATDGTVPTASNALTLTINNPSIKAGSTAYQIIGDDVTALGTATIDGQIVVSLTSDPVISVTNDTISNNNNGNGGGDSGSSVVTSAVKSAVTSIKASLFKPSLTVYSASPRFSLDTLTKSKLKKYAKKQENNSSITCIGYIYPNTKSTKTTKLATAQATNVCKYLKTQNKTLKTIIEIKSAKTAPKAAPGARWITTSYRVDGVLVRAL